MDSKEYLSGADFHYSLKYGWSENRIVMTFGFISWISVLVCWLIWKYAL